MSFADLNLATYELFVFKLYILYTCTIYVWHSITHCGWCAIKPIFTSHPIQRLLTIACSISVAFLPNSHRSGFDVPFRVSSICQTILVLTLYCIWWLGFNFRAFGLKNTSSLPLLPDQLCLEWWYLLGYYLWVKKKYYPRLETKWRLMVRLRIERFWQS